MEPRPRRAGRRSLVPLALLAAACATGDGESAPDDPPSGAPVASPADTAAVTALSPRSGPPGTAVRLEGGGFPPESRILIGFGPPDSEFEVVDTTEADARGAVAATVEVPAWADPGRRYVFVLTTPAYDPKPISEAFQVVGEGGTVRVEAVFTDEGVECPAVRADDGTLYTLAGGDTSGLSPGDRVVVVGTVAEMSTCMQGITLAVTSIERR